MGIGELGGRIIQSRYHFRINAGIGIGEGVVACMLLISDLIQDVLGCGKIGSHQGGNQYEGKNNDFLHGYGLLIDLLLNFSSEATSQASGLTFVLCLEDVLT